MGRGLKPKTRRDDMTTKTKQRFDVYEAVTNQIITAEVVPEIRTGG